MKRISLSFLFPLLTLILLVIILNQKIFTVPPLGKLLNPFNGIVQNEEDYNANLELNFDRKKSIEVIFDERAIPHIFSNSQNDMFFTQGYVTATDRLWQMDFLSYVSAGRLGEILGEDLLEYDRHQRRSGILSSAKTTLEFIEANVETKAALDNYTQGVNKYIEGLSEANLPLEYKLMDYHPEHWTNLKSVLIMKYMGSLLSGYEEDVASSYLLAALGKKDFNKLFSNYLIDTKNSKFAISLIKDSLPFRSYIDFSFLESSPQIQNTAFNPRLGSNSWAIGPKKSALGCAILCNDPHLNLSLPAVWYELQLQSDETNVYGYSIPGTPGVIIGYNQHISWGLTTGAIDVRDVFKLELKADYSQYKYDGIWKNTKQMIEEIKLKNSKPFYDTVFYTIHGPISSDFNFGSKETAGFATKWTIYDPSNEFLTFIKLNKASNYEQFKEALQYYKCPVQNFSFADIEGNIATHLQGKIIKSHWQGNGKFILDGTKSEYLSTEVLSGELPYVYNPSEGFVGSANNYPFQNNKSFYVTGHNAELRFNKIKQLLSGSKKFTIEDMKGMQLNNINRLAELAVPILLKYFDGENTNYIKKFRNWNYEYSAETETAFIFENWWALIENNTWDELRRFPKVDKLPDDLVLLDLLNNDPNNKYFDNLSTDKIETAEDIVKGSLKNLTQSWLQIPIKWGNINNISITHLSKISAFSKRQKYTSGHPNAINALAKSWGPALRFIVEMSKNPQGYGIYAGGQSGNPASKKYDSFINDWGNGKYYKLNFFLNKKEAKSKTSFTWIIK